jgi:hypothetical protein
VLDRLLAFSEALRDAGVPVSVGENLDAVRSVEHVEWLDRSAWRSALAATMIKSEAHRPAFDLLFELYFGLSRIADDSPRETAEPEQFIAELADALGGGDGGGLQDLAERAVEQFGRVEDSPSGNLFFEYPIWRAVDTFSLPRPPTMDPSSPLSRTMHSSAGLQSGDAWCKGKCDGEWYGDGVRRSSRAIRSDRFPRI